MNNLTNDINVLTSYSFCLFNSKNEQILAIKKSDKEETLTTLNRKDITCWELFKRLFGKGKLANLHISLQSVARYLDKTNWHSFADQNENSQNYKAYLTVCEVAKRSLLKNNTSLWRKTSSPKEFLFFDVRKITEKSSTLIDPGNLTTRCRLLTNPAMDAQTLHHLVKLRFLGKNIKDPNFVCDFKIYRSLCSNEVGKDDQPIYKILPNDRTVLLEDGVLDKILIKLFGCYVVRWKLPNTRHI